MTILIHELLIYPIKSCAPIRVNEAQTTRYGLASATNPILSDRRWMLVKGARQRNQRHFPRMALIQPSFTDEGLKIDAPGMETLLIPYEPTGKILIDIEEINVKGRVYDENVSIWFSTFLQVNDLDLVYFDESFKPQFSKTIEPEYPNTAQDSDVITYQDMSPFHLASLESTFDLNSRLKKQIEVYNFRPNIIVKGIDEPYDEDFWREIKIGKNVKLRWFRSCLRCLLPTINQKTGINDPEKEPWKTLQTYRRKADLYGIKAQFGVYLSGDDHGIIRVGDELTVLKEDKNF